MHPFADADLARRLEAAEAARSTRFVEARARLNPATGACWIQVAGGFAIFDGPESPVTQTFGLGVFQTTAPSDMDKIERFFAERDGRPIATGALTISNGVAHLAGASTVPEARKGGAQLALLEHRLRYAASANCDLAMMGALPGGGSQRNAERVPYRVHAGEMAAKSEAPASRQPP
jgi:hypothetical protein